MNENKENNRVPLGWQQFKTVDQIIAAYKQRKEKPTLKTNFIKDDA